MIYHDTGRMKFMIDEHHANNAFQTTSELILWRSWKHFSIKLPITIYFSLKVCPQWVRSMQVRVKTAHIWYKSSVWSIYQSCTWTHRLIINIKGFFHGKFICCLIIYLLNQFSSTAVHHLEVICMFKVLFIKLLTKSKWVNSVTTFRAK